MLLSIKEMEVRKRPFAVTLPPGEIDFGESGARQIGPLEAEGVAELLELDGAPGEQVHVKGRVKTSLETDCDRCLGPAAFAIDTPFDLYYKPIETMAGADDEVGIDEGEAEIGFYELPGLVLEDILREQVLLQLPMQRVCVEDCKGICPLCGVNRNETECHCEAVLGNPGDERWNALKDIHI